MRDVVVIGGGLTGLAAAVELERLKIPYRLIEVKKRLGGSIISENRNGFVFDGGVFALPAVEAGLMPDVDGEALCAVYDGHNRDPLHGVTGERRSPWAAFTHGSQSLIDGLAQRLTRPILRQMAVSSLGRLNGRFTICMENGLVFEAGAVIVAAPARYAERMFRALQPELSAYLMDYRYDTITRVSLGYRREQVPQPPTLPWDMAVPFVWWTEAAVRVPAGHVMLHVGVRTTADLAASEGLIAAVHEALHATGQPVSVQVHYWAEADPLLPHERGFAAWVKGLEAFVPEGVALAGSDYDGLGLRARLEAGQGAARKVAGWLGV